jgi:beta-galactosidase
MDPHPMVHMTIHHDNVEVPAFTREFWDWPKMVSHWTLPSLSGQTVKVYTFTNCESVELIVNGSSQGTKYLSNFSNTMITWDVTYNPGTIQAIGRNNGSQVTSQEYTTAGSASGIRLIPYRTTIDADGVDIAEIEVNIIDSSGRLVPSATHQINFSVIGI